MSEEDAKRKSFITLQRWGKKSIYIKKKVQEKNTFSFSVSAVLNSNADTLENFV